jgi:cysteine synthase A
LYGNPQPEPNMGFIANIWARIYENILDNKGKLTASGGLIVGIILTLTFKDLYPDLEHSFQKRIRRYRHNEVRHPLPGQPDYVRLEDHTRKVSKAIIDQTDARRSKAPDEKLVSVGIEGLIGNTPLFKLRALSEATGCEILAKAEFLNGAGNSPKDRVALSMINSAEEEARPWRHHIRRHCWFHWHLISRCLPSQRLQSPHVRPRIMKEVS